MLNSKLFKKLQMFEDIKEGKRQVEKEEQEEMKQLEDMVKRAVEKAVKEEMAKYKEQQQQPYYWRFILGTVDAGGTGIWTDNTSPTSAIPSGSLIAVDSSGSITINTPIT